MCLWFIYFFTLYICIDRKRIHEIGKNDASDYKSILVLS